MPVIFYILFSSLFLAELHFTVCWFPEGCPFLRNATLPVKPQSCLLRWTNVLWPVVHNEFCRLLACFSESFSFCEQGCCQSRRKVSVCLRGFTMNPSLENTWSAFRILSCSNHRWKHSTNYSKRNYHYIFQVISYFFNIRLSHCSILLIYDDPSTNDILQHSL